MVTKRPNDHGKHQTIRSTNGRQHSTRPNSMRELEHCHFFESKILIKVMQSLTDVNIYDKEDDMEADIRKHLRLCVVVLKTVISYR